MSRAIYLMAVAAAALAFVVASCAPDGAEKVGNRAISADQSATEGQEDLTDGPMENAGERIDDAAASSADTEDAKAVEPTP